MVFYDQGNLNRRHIYGFTHFYTPVSPGSMGIGGPRCVQGPTLGEVIFSNRRLQLETPSSLGPLKSIINLG